MKAYYEARAPEYDDWDESSGRFAGRERPAGRELLGELAATLRALPPKRTLDVACGTAYATRWLPGEITGLDQSESMLAEARRVAPELLVVEAALREDVRPAEYEERVLNDGSRWTVYKRYFTPEGLLEELGGGRVVYAGRWFVAVSSPRG